MANERDVIENWVAQIEKVHAAQGSADFTYSIPAPGDVILDLWGQEMENLLRTVDLPPPAVDLTPEQYCRFCCLLLDTPAADNPVEGAHMLATNYQDVLDSTEQMRQQGYLK